MTYLIKGTAVAALLLSAGCQQAPEHNEAADRAAIHQLMMEYGRTLDERDFDGFTQLWTEDGDYNGTPGPDTGETMREVFAKNASGAREPNFHVFFNEVVTFDGPDKANATSMSFWVVPNEQGQPEPLMLGQYEDELVRVDGTWKFKSRKVNAPMAPVPTDESEAEAE